MQNKLKHVLILGCGRSGTSIFGELFEHLPQYTYYSEPAYELLKELDYSQPVAIKVPRESVNISPTEGLSFPLEDLLELFRGRYSFSGRCGTHWIPSVPCE